LRLDFSQPDKPTENAHIEAFNAHIEALNPVLRRERLSQRSRVQMPRRAR
jgi:hypothetical protein